MRGVGGAGLLFGKRGVEASESGTSRQGAQFAVGFSDVDAIGEISGGEAGPRR